MSLGFYRVLGSDSTEIIPSEWIRPEDWLVMPTVNSGEDTFVGLYAIFPEENNFAAFSFTTSTGQYRVDWGDGTITTHNSGVAAEKTYDYASVSNSTLSSRGYKQVIIKITAVSGLLRTCSFNVRRTTTPVQNQAYATGFLDCIISLPNANTGASITFGATLVRHNYCEKVDVRSIGGCTSLIGFFNFCYALQSVSLSNTGAVTTMLSMFNNCHSLKTIPLFDTSSVVNMETMFQNCYALQSVPLFNTTSVVNMFSMFNNCYSIITMPLLNMSSVTNMQGLFANCHSLTSVPLFSIQSSTNMVLMFQNCYSLKIVPLFNTQSVLNMQGMFQGCLSIKSVPLFNTVSVTDMNNMFNSCYSLESVPLLNTASVTFMSNMFNNCFSLQVLPLFNTASVTTMASMFLNCYALRTVPLFNTASVTSMANMFQNCFSLQTIPLFNTASVTNMGIMFNSCGLQSIPALSTASITATSGTDFGTSFALNCGNLDRCQMSFSRIVTLASCQLSQTAIEEIFNNLVSRGTASSTTIDISGNWGVGSIFSKTCSASAGSVTISITDTSSLAVGMQVVGNGTPLTTGVSVSFSDSTDRVTLTSHGLQNGDEVSFSSISTTTGIIINTIYYVRNITTNDFQLSATPSGTIINLVTNGTGTMRHKSVIVSIATNTSVTMSRQMRSTITGTSLTFRALQTGTALLKNWAVTG
jgi:surface protein